MLMVMLFWVAFTVTFRVGLRLPDKKWSDGGADAALFVVDLIIDLCFIIDLLLQFQTAQLDERGALIVDGKILAKNYLKSWFAFDLLAVVGGVWDFFSDESGVEQTRSVKLIRFVKLLRLVKAARMVTVVKAYEGVFRPLCLAVGMTMLMAWVMHTLACLWFLVGCTEEEEDSCDQLKYSAFKPMLHPEWSATDRRDCMRPANRGWVIRAGWFDPDSKYPDADRPDSMTVYLESWRAMLIREQEVETKAERIFLIFADLIIAASFAVFSAQIFTKISAMQISQEVFNRKMSELEEFCYAMRLPKSVKKELMTFYKFLYERNTVFDQQSILDELPIHMRRKVVHLRCKTMTLSQLACMRASC